MQRRQEKYWIKARGIEDENKSRSKKCDNFEREARGRID